jgi:hypothetical protein
MANQITPNPSVPSQVVAEVKFPKFINNLGIIPTSYKDSMSYYECLAWLCKFLEEQVIPTVNENGEAVEELQALYVELNSYVTHYFDTLDVQEEINNKLDDMVEAGTLQEIIADYLNSKAIFGFVNVEEMTEAQNLINGSYARTCGFYEKNDGGGALYKIRTLTNQDTVNNINIIAMEDETLIAELINDSSSINIKKLGAKNSSPNTNNNDIATILEFAYDNYSEIIIPKGEYFLSRLDPNSYGKQDKTIKGQGNPTIFTSYGFEFEGLNSGSYGDRITNLFIEGINFYGSGRSNNNRVGTGISLKWFGEVYIRNCYFRYLDKGVEMINGSEAVLENSPIIACNYGLFIENTHENQYTDLDAVSINDCAISNSNYCVIIDSIRGINFNNCQIMNSSAQNNGLVIKNTYLDTINVNINGCEFENNDNKVASITIGQEGETHKANMVNIENCKFTMYEENAIDIYDASIVNLINNFFTYTYLRIVTIEASANADLKINLLGQYYSFETRIVDYRTSYHGNFFQNKFNQLNFFPDMDHSISEFATTVAPTYSNGKVTFAGSGYFVFRIKSKNYNPIEGVGLIVIGKNISSCACVKNGSVQQSNIITNPSLSDSRKCYFNIFRGENISEIRINVQNGTEIEKVVLLGTTRDELPDFRTANVSDVNYIGEPSKGDTFKATSSNLANKSLITWNGTSYTQV